MSFKYKVFILVFLAVTTRFIGLNWGDNFFFHPDENNMATALSQLSFQNFNPHFFAYGQFPLYLGYFTLKVFGITNSFINSIFILRFYSALFSILSIYLIYLISKKIFSSKLSLLVVLLTIFSPGLIQLAHFGTTESFLVFVFLLEIYLSLKIYDQESALLSYLLSGIFSGITVSTKISSLIFLGPILLVTLMNFIRQKNKIKTVINFLIFVNLAFTFYVLSSPYNLINKSDFLSAINYETSVATGQTKVFYTTQFTKSIPYLFQLIKVFPYSAGIFQYIFFFIGFIIFIKKYSVKKKIYLYYILILIPSFVYFLYFGQLYTKWTRFLSPLFFLFPLSSAYFVSSLSSKFYRLISIILACLPGLFFFRLYLSPDTRIQASDYLVSTLTPDSTLLSESGNVVDIPVLPHSFKITSYDFYNNYPNNLSNYLLTTDYIIVPSRRIFKNYQYPYYQHLFDGTLGFQEIKNFTPHYDLFLNSENAEETWSVFDHPTIRIFQKVQNLTTDQYENLFQN